MRAAALLVATLVIGVAPAEAREGGRCRVRYVTGKRAYLEVGRQDGIQLQDKVPLLRNGRSAGSCAVDSVADHSSTCISDRAAVGDQCRLQHAAPPPLATPSSGAEVQPPVARTASEQAKIDVAIAQTPVDKVVFQTSASAVGRPRPLFVGSAGHTAWVTFDGSHYQQERIDLQLRGVSLRFGGFRAYASLTAIVASVRPPTQRFRPNDIAQVYVWQTEFSSREHGRPFAFAIGRIWPRFAPGLSVLDGAQVGWRKRDGSAEVGVFGGTLPDASTLYPSYQRWLAGLYFGHVWNPRGAGPLRMVLQDGRINVRQTDKAGLQLETEMSLLFSFGKRFDFATAARATLGAGRWSNPELEAIRAHFNVRPVERLRIGGSFRYLGERATDYDGLGTMFSQGRQYYGTLDATGDVTSWLGLTLSAQVQHDDASGNGRQSLLGELSFRKLPRRGGVVAIGYQESFGWLRGHQAYVQYSNAEHDRFRLMLRAGYAEDLAIPGAAWHREVSANVFGEVRLVRWLALRASCLARIVVASPTTSGEEGEDGERGGVPGGIVARVDLIGSI